MTYLLSKLNRITYILEAEYNLILVLVSKSNTKMLF